MGKNTKKTQKSKDWLLAIRTDPNADTIYQVKSSAGVKRSLTFETDLSGIKHVRNGIDFQGIEGRKQNKLIVSPTKLKSPHGSVYVRRIDANLDNPASSCARVLMFSRAETLEDAPGNTMSAEEQKDIFDSMYRPDDQEQSVEQVIDQNTLQLAKKQKRDNLNEFYGNSATNTAHAVLNNDSGRFEYSHTLAHSHGGDSTTVCVASAGHNSLRLAGLEMPITDLVKKEGCSIEYADTVKFKKDENGNTTFVAEHETVELRDENSSRRLSLYFHNPCALFTPSRSTYEAMSVVMREALVRDQPSPAVNKTQRRSSERLASKVGKSSP